MKRINGNQPSLCQIDIYQCLKKVILFLSLNGLIESTIVEIYWKVKPWSRNCGNPFKLSVLSPSYNVSRIVTKLIVPVHTPRMNFSIDTTILS